DLGRRGHDHVVDPLWRQPGGAPEQLAHDLDAQVVGPRAPEDAFGAGPPEGRPDAVDEVHLAQLSHGETLVNTERVPAEAETRGMAEWEAHRQREERRYRDGEERLDDARDEDARQRQ